MVRRLVAANLTTGDSADQRGRLSYSTAGSLTWTRLSVGTQ
jgi:hypothetical protein